MTSQPEVTVGKNETEPINLQPGRLSVRRCRLIDVHNSMEPETATKIARNLVDRIETNPQAYIETVTKACEGELVSKPPMACWREDGPTAVVDYPVLLLKTANGIPLALRLIVAICTGTTKSKAWCRASWPTDEFPSPPPDISKIAELYRAITDACAVWGAQSLMSAMAQNDIRTDLVGPQLEVTTLGVCGDQKLASAFEKMVWWSETARLPTDAPVQADYVMTYFRALENGQSSDPDIEHSVGKTIDSTRTSDPQPLWAFSEVLVDNAAGYPEVGEVLYHLRSTNGLVTATGVGLDTSGPGELAHRSAASMAFWLGKHY